MEPIHPTRVIRDRNGWHASTRIDLSCARLLEIHTRRHQGSNRLVTHATVSTVRDGFLSHVIGHDAASGDFSRCVLAESRPRITENVVRAQHARALERLDALKQAVDDHYLLQQRLKDAEANRLATVAH